MYIKFSLNVHLLENSRYSTTADFPISKLLHSHILAGKTASHVKNSRHFVHVMADLRIEVHEVLVSFDVSSLFTNVPVDEAVHVICDRLWKDEALADRTTLSPDRIADLLEMCLKSTYFSYGGELFEQLEGAAMGSTVSAVVADLYMEFFEVQALRTAPTKPRLWKRYVDNTCCIMKKGSGRAPDPPEQCATVYQVHSGGGEGRKMPAPFLTHPEEGWWKPGHHRLQETNTHRPVPGFPLSPSNPGQEGTGQVLVRQSQNHHHRAEQLAEGRTPSHQSLEAERIPQCFHLLLFQTPQTGHGGNQDIATGRRALTPTGDAPLHRRGQWGCQMGLQEVWHEGCLHVWTLLLLHADQSEGPLMMEKQVKVVYRIPCSCGEAYIGETVRRLEARVKEHRDACQKGALEKSALAEHAWKNHRPIKWEEVSVIDWARTVKELLVKEAIHIRLNHPSLNKDGSLELPRCWLASLKNTRGGSNQRPVVPTDSSSNSTWWGARLYNDKCSYELHLCPEGGLSTLTETSARQTCLSHTEIREPNLLWLHQGRCPRFD